jgi:hypothetical protein
MWKESDMQGIMAIADVIVVNYGLHYGVRARMRGNHARATHCVSGC